jgi:type I restriction enzyme, R subunit
MSEADTCRRFVVPKLESAGWDVLPFGIAEQRNITNARLRVVGGLVVRAKPKRVDYLLHYQRDFPTTVVEAKADCKSAAEGLSQVKRYAQMLDLKFAYATNGGGIIEFDYIAGEKRFIESFPAPEERWARLNSKRPLLAEALPAALAPYHPDVENPKILLLAGRNILVDDPRDKTFKPFGDARCKIENGEIVHGREMHFAIYQSIAEDAHRPNLYKEFAPDFFDLIIVDECHRGSAREESSWREILDTLLTRHAA